jgi:hypothetical protein
MLKTIAWRCTLAGYAGAACALTGHLDPQRGVAWMFSALVLLCISIYHAEKYEQMKRSRI